MVDADDDADDDEGDDDDDDDDDAGDDDGAGVCSDGVKENGVGDGWLVAGAAEGNEDVNG